MRNLKLLLLAILVNICVLSNAQQQSEQPVVKGTMRVYAELLGTGTNFLGLNKNVKVTVDMGQYQSTWNAYTLQDENGKDIKFNSMVAAMNYMGQRGWYFVQAYVVTESSNKNVYHWLMYKDIKDSSEIMEGLRVKNME